MIISPPVRFIIALIASALILSGCSESGNSSSPDLVNTATQSSSSSDAGGVISNSGEESTGRNPLADDTIHNDELRAAFPGRQTLFGEDISRIPNPDFFHDNTLMSWSYEIVNGQLVSSEFETPLSHQIAWQRYQQLTLPEDRMIVDLVKFLAGSANSSNGYVIVFGPEATVPGQAEVQLQLNEHFVAELFDVHQHQRPNNYSDTQTLLHLHGYVLEAAHQIKFDHEYNVPTYALGFGSRMLWDSPTHEFYWNFWEGEVLDSWLELEQGTQELQTKMLEKFPDQFVSASATRFPSSDFSESFVYFVTQDEMPEVGAIAGAEKIRWFWTQPEYVNAREVARAAF